MRYLKHHHTPTVVAAALAALLTACSDSGILETGGGAGDTTDTPASTENNLLIQPFVGLYDLQDNWNGILGDEAFLAIREPGSEGIAEAVLIDFDDFSNCVPTRPLTGAVSVDPFSTRIFMDDIPQFDQAELFITGDTLTIEFNDLGDIDGDGSSTDTTVVQAVEIFIAEMDLGVPC